MLQTTRQQSTANRCPALVASPVTYAETRVKTFIVKDRIVYEADLGAETEAVVKAINSFNPDDSWEITAD